MIATTNTNDAFVQVANLAKHYGAAAAVSDISLSVTEGETLALLGASGCGKTTVLRCIAGLETPTSGSISIGGQTVFNAATGTNVVADKRSLGVVFQSYAVWPHMTVAQNVGFPLKVRGIGAREMARDVDQILDLIGLLPMRDRSATALSGGQQQRVALGRALVHKPKLVLFDEPMSNLDAKLRDQMRVELKLLQQELGFTSIYVTHDQSEAFALADRIAVMNLGRIEALDAPAQLFRWPPTPYVAAFFGYNVMPAHIETIDPNAVVGAGRPKTYSVRVKLPEGSALDATFVGEQPPSVGSAVSVCVRREHVTFASPDDTASIPGTIRTVVFQGGHDEYDIRVGDVSLRALRTGGVMAPGPARLKIAKEDALVIPATDGQSTRQT